MVLNLSPPTVDSVNWATLGHAYGPATDVPEYLALLESEEESDRKNAFDALYCTVYHQGTRYSASVAIVPFLVALAANPAVHGRDQLVGLLCNIALGDIRQFLPRGVDIASQRQEVERLQSLTIEDKEREFHKWVAASPNEWVQQLRMSERKYFEKRHLELEISLAAYDAVKDKALSTFCEFLRQDSDARAREAAAHAVAFFPESSHKTLPLLRPIVFQDESSGENIPEGILATAIVSYVLLLSTSLPSSPATTDDRAIVEQKLHYFLSHQSPVLRWAAAIGLSRLSIVDPLVLATLASTVTTPPEAVPKISFYFGGIGNYALESLEAACKARSTPVLALKSSLAALLDVLARPNCDKYDIILFTCCALLWPTPQDSPFNQDPPTRYEDLASEEQRRFFKAMAESRPTREEGPEGLEARTTWNLPADRDAYRRYVGLPEEGPYGRVVITWREQEEEEWKSCGCWMAIKSLTATYRKRWGTPA
ncbi:hypothetical protein GP486_001791 [Trichoglossum hirsutum]|uniref:Uncharacterized protein n=1 Tax=Trichoglossum hirsutum TaxID=265104 RepID=A0A9P8LGC5_9PEZI|nr:hypothetical protein GP486_001791 [Trichoglossum hirsutum]